MDYMEVAGRLIAISHVAEDLAKQMIAEARRNIAQEYEESDGLPERDCGQHGHNTSFDSCTACPYQRTKRR